MVFQNCAYKGLKNKRNDAILSGMKMVVSVVEQLHLILPPSSELLADTDFVESKQTSKQHIL